VFSVYVYYRIDPRHADTTETPIRAMQTQLAYRTGATAQLLKKCGAPLLWMEIYTGISDAEAFLRELSNVTDESDVGVYLDGERHVECFHADASCRLPSTCRGNEPGTTGRCDN